MVNKIAVLLRVLGVFLLSFSFSLSMARANPAERWLACLVWNLNWVAKDSKLAAWYGERGTFRIVVEPLNRHFS